ncbi:hypothetical protein AKJ44_01315 [candidate division MSBL1 archaeon SCGC-AAA261F17]|uniref:RecF/RecN/SMC N-terminal domain-containing protein n=1 Tax=candidate division MSBL1 archaeon SCGC-AAA261F17 TaxID=1698274 RepID=A0A133V6Q0_9EURY|nr:hypothetical protein AKJ44_01315 [candidate division MSBL1 archaeon SCGC-AAA261F17]
MTFIKEIILENFMSYTYARIPLKRGLNLICGPNGAGKSSILLALSVALGQTYTERSRKLSDLIRRGEDIGRVSVVFDNSPNEGKRPIPEVDSDSLVLSRYLKQDGTYWHEANYETVTKGEVTRTLSQLSINPNNMLIVMHQGMIDVFGAIDAQERLKLVEEAVGMREYRERILRAREKLSHTLSEEESVNAMLEEAQDTLEHWEEEYQRYLQKKELLEKKEDLEREYTWSKWWRQKKRVEDFENKLKKLGKDLEEINRDLEKAEEKGEKSRTSLEKIEGELDNQYQELIIRERDKSGAKTKLDIINNLDSTTRDRGKLPESISKLVENSRELEENIAKLEHKIESVKTTLTDLKRKRDQKREKYVDQRVRKAVLGFRRELLEKEASSLKSDLRRSKRELKELQIEAEEEGSRVKTERDSRAILEDIRVTNAQLTGLEDVSSDAEKMYKRYKELLAELEERAEEAAENRKRALEELELRKEKWRDNLRELLKNVGETYKQILGRVNAIGDVRLINPEDIDDSGLELLVGFRGADPQPLDAYTQSGGERSTSIMCFLLALQQHIESPIRGLDEFELHMDPRNRQTMLRQLFDLMRESDAQYLVITPGRLVEVEEVPNVIAVQNAAGSSEVKVTA